MGSSSFLPQVISPTAYLSPYAYCTGDPVNLVDFDGKDAKVTITDSTITEYFFFKIGYHSIQEMRVFR